MTQVALQLWTIRDELESDLEGALRRVGEVGYDGVELIELPGRSREELVALLADAGLAVAGRHVSLEAVEDDLSSLAHDVRAFGTDRVAISWVSPEQLADPEPLVERIADAARGAAGAGLRLGFHNHWGEVEPLPGGGTFLGLLRELPADLLWLELDLGWVWQGGGDPIAELAATRGRCPLVHVKDYANRTGRDDVPVGDGLVGYDRVLPAAIEAGAEWLIVEEDDVGPDPFGAVARSLDYVRSVIA